MGEAFRHLFRSAGSGSTVYLCTFRLYARNAGTITGSEYRPADGHHPYSGCATFVLFFAGGVTFLHSAYHINRQGDR